MAESAPAQPAAASAPPPSNGTKWKKPKKKPQDVTLYELMEVNWDASPDEIKKAYRKRALKLHPDKGGDPAKFHAMKRAYDVLSDDKKRAAYDKYGPEMLRVMEGEASPEVLVMLLLKQRRYRALILAIAILVVGFLVLFPVLQAVRWDGASWSWAVVFIPIWLVFALVFLAQLQLLYRGPPTGEGEEPSAKAAPPAFSDVLTLVLLFSGAVIFTAFLSARLDSTITWNWYTVIIPWLVFEITLCVHRFLGARQAVAHMKLQLQAIREYQVKTINEAKADLEGGDLDAAVRINEAEEAIKTCDEELKILGMSKSYLLTAFFWPALRFATAFLIAARANNDFTGTWFLTAIPFMFGTAVFPILEGIRAREDPESADGAGRACCMGFIQYSIALLIWLLGMAKMDNPDIYSAFAVWGPYFVLAGFLFCNMTLILCVNPEDMISQQQQNGGAAGAEATGANATGATNGEPVGEPVVQAPSAEVEKKPEEAPNVIILT